MDIFNARNKNIEKLFYNWGDYGTLWGWFQGQLYTTTILIIKQTWKVREYPGHDMDT